MIKQKRSVVQKICLLAGIGLIAAAVAVMALWQWGVSSSEQKAEEYVNTIRSLIPEPQGAALEELGDDMMPSLSLDGKDFVGIIEIPRYDSVLPVCLEWGHSSKYPCCFSGSIYDGTMQIGATSNKGQYDFYREISVGDEITFTDMVGNKFAYEVTDIHYSKNTDQTALESENADLTLFIKNVYAFEYIIVFCSIVC